MIDVALLFPPLRVSRDFIDYPYFADLGAVQAAAVLRAAGRSVRLVDAFAMEGAGLGLGNDPLEDGYVHLGAPAAAALAAMPRDARVIVVAFTPFHRPPARDALLGSILGALRAAHPTTPIVLADLYQSGQHLVDARSEETLSAYPEVDVLLRYEAEELLAPLVDDLAKSGRPARPYALTGGEPALDPLPLPAWDLVDMPRYFAFQRLKNGKIKGRTLKIRAI